MKSIYDTVYFNVGEKFLPALINYDGLSLSNSEFNEYEKFMGSLIDKFGMTYNLKLVSYNEGDINKCELSGKITNTAKIEVRGVL